MEIGVFCSSVEQARYRALKKLEEEDAIITTVMGSKVTTKDGNVIRFFGDIDNNPSKFRGLNLDEVWLDDSVRFWDVIDHIHPLLHRCGDRWMQRIKRLY